MEKNTSSSPVATPLTKPGKLRDVALAAGVSTASVSRALNHPEVVSAALREKIRVAAGQLAYLPDAAAQALSSRRSRIAAALVPSVDHYGYARMLEVWHDAFERAGYVLLVGVSHSDAATEIIQVTRFLGQRVEAMILCGAAAGAELRRVLMERETPFVFCDPSLEVSATALAFDYASAAGIAVDHLRQLGHGRYAVLSRNRASSPMTTAVIAALAERGLENAAVIDCGAALSSVRANMAGLLERAPAPTALFCDDDLIAASVLKVCGERGVFVPRDVSIVSWGDSEIARLTVPSLTALRMPWVEMARRGASLAMQQILGEPSESTAALTVKLVLRGSSAALAQA